MVVDFMAYGGIESFTGHRTRDARQQVVVAQSGNVQQAVGHGEPVGR
jgi:hypothetical protein